MAYRKAKIGHLSPYPHVRSTLLALDRRGIKLGVVSDAPRLQAWLRLTEMNLVEYFDVILGKEDTGKLKPSKEPFMKAAKKMNLKPEDILFVGDNPERDIPGAKKVGMITALALYGQTIKGHGADYKLKDFKDILKIVSKQ